MSAEAPGTVDWSYERGLINAARAVCELCRYLGSFDEEPAHDLIGWWHPNGEYCDASPIHDLLHAK